MRRKVGKRIGNCIYVHCKYELEIVPSQILRNAKQSLRQICKDPYTCIKYNKENQSVTFQWSKNFDQANEPIVDKCILVKKNGNIKILPQPKDPYIWHHKWQWVDDNYKGFDVEKSKAHSKIWECHISKEEKRKIGKLSFWNKIKNRWE